MKKIYPILFVMVLCSSFGKAETGEDEIVYQIRYGYYSVNLDSKEVEKLNSYNGPGKITAHFRTIPGEFFGKSGRQVLYEELLNEEENLTLVLPNDMQRESKPLTYEDLLVIPQETEISRLATYHLDSGNIDKVGGGGFVNSNNGDFIVLVYFSNPATITGTLNRFGEAYTYDLKVKRSGWNWVSIRKKSKIAFLVTAYDGPLSDIEFAVITSVNRGK